MVSFPNTTHQPTHLVKYTLNMSMAMYMQMCADEEMALELEGYQTDRALALALSGFDQVDAEYVESDDDDVVLVEPAPVARKIASKLANAGVGETCNICLEDMASTQKRAVLKCRHVYHEKCLKKWTQRSKTCPVDRLAFRKMTVVKGS